MAEPHDRNREQIAAAIEHLRAARGLLGSAPKAQARVRAALRSAEGARRHAGLAEARERRKADTNMLREFVKRGAAAQEAVDEEIAKVRRS